jgi:hypothetical protein
MRGAVTAFAEFTAEQGLMDLPLFGGGGGGGCLRGLITCHGLGWIVSWSL